MRMLSQGFNFRGSPETGQRIDRLKKVFPLGIGKLIEHAIASLERVALQGLTPEEHELYLDGALTPEAYRAARRRSAAPKHEAVHEAEAAE
jgi:hypothetical protein